MPSGRWPSNIKAFKRWSTDQVDRGEVAGNSATSSSKGRKWRLKRRKRKKKRGFQD